MENCISKKESDFEIGFYEKIVRQSPNFVEALMALGDLYTKVGRYEDGLEIDKRLTRLCPENPFVLYNLACSYALLNENEKSFEAVKRAVSLGYDDIEFLCKDDDLKNLRLDERFQDYFASLWNSEQAKLPRRKEGSPRVFKDQ